MCVFFYSTERKSSILNFITLLNESEKRQSPACKWRVDLLKYSTKFSSAELPKTGNKYNWQCEEPFECSFLLLIHSPNSKSSIHVSIAEWLRYFIRISFDKVQSQSVFSLSSSFFFFWIAGFIPLIPHTNFLMPKKKVQQLIRYKNMLFYRIHIGNNPIWMFFSSGKLQAVSNFYSRKQWLEICFYFYFCLFGSFHRKNVCDFIFIILCGKCGVSERVRCGSNA